MPRFYIDTSDQKELAVDSAGYDFATIDAAVIAAIEALPDMARETLPDGQSRTFVAAIRDEHGKTLVCASLAFNVTWLTPQQQHDKPGTIQAND